MSDIDNDLFNDKTPPRKRAKHLSMPEKRKPGRPRAAKREFTVDYTGLSNDDGVGKDDNEDCDRTSPNCSDSRLIESEEQVATKEHLESPKDITPPKSGLKLDHDTSSNIHLRFGAVQSFEGVSNISSNP